MKTKQQKDQLIYSRFRQIQSAGYPIMQATEMVMNEFNILSSMTIYNIRKRCNSKKKIE